MINAIRSGRAQILTHIFVTKYFKCDIEKIAEEACKHNIFLSLDTQWMTERRIYGDTISNLKIIVEVVRKHNKKVIVSSDAHNIWEMADDSSLEKIKDKIGLTDDLIINNYQNELMAFLGK